MSKEKIEKGIIEIERVAKNSYVVKAILRTKNRDVEVARILAGDGRYWGLPAKSLMFLESAVCFMRFHFIMSGVKEVEIVGEKVECAF